MANTVKGSKTETKDAPSSGQITTGAKGANSVFSSGPEGAVRVGAYLNDKINPNNVKRS